MKDEKCKLAKRTTTLHEINLTLKPSMASGYAEVDMLFIGKNHVRELTLKFPYSTSTLTAELQYDQLTNGFYGADTLMKSLQSLSWSRKPLQ
jgi:hypothetical protein